VLVMGYRLNSAAWPVTFIEQLARRFTVITLDNRGTGLSDKPVNGYAIANLARDVCGAGVLSRNRPKRRRPRKSLPRAARLLRRTSRARRKIGNAVALHFEPIACGLRAGHPEIRRDRTLQASDPRDIFGVSCVFPRPSVLPTRENGRLRPEAADPGCPLCGR
jgi:hypothetical protein